MYNFEFSNPVKIIFGKGSIPKVADEIQTSSKVLMIYGGGSIKRTVFMSR
jgi:NADP-dependent alcohol dehydrogenase